MIPTSDRMLSIGGATTSTAVKTRELRAASHRINSFAAGELDVASSAVSAAIAAAASERLQHYGPPGGLLTLSKAVAGQLSRSDRTLEDSNLVVAGTGIKDGLTRLVGLLAA
ncbi:hypothetical protein AB0H36_39925 [Kribbella sp. NPDC050820]|uniref:hypothetical protein n=1 Tax=Kribbella sp. NPDC050820 TaxID=3155408 RepID=UPI0033F9761D